MAGLNDPRWVNGRQRLAAVSNGGYFDITDQDLPVRKRPNNRLWSALRCQADIRVEANLRLGVQLFH